VRHLITFSLIVSIGILVVGCSGRKSMDDQLMTRPQKSSVSDGVLTSGRFTSKQGTMQFVREFRLHTDGRVTDTLTVEGTHKFGDYWRQRYDMLATSGVSYALSKEEGGERFAVKAQRVFVNVDQLNQSSGAYLKNVNGMLFRSVSLRTDTGPYDSETMVNTYGMHEQATAEDWIGFLREAVTVDFVVNDEATGKTLRWHRTAGQIGSGLQVELATKQWYATAYIGGTLIACFLGFVVYMGTLGRRHWEVKEE